MPLLSNNKIQVVPVSLPKDGFALKPGFHDYIKENPTLPQQSFKDKFVTKAQIMGITSLDNKSALIIGNDFARSTGDGESTMNCHEKQIQELQQCLSCLRKFQDAIVEEECHTTVCEECSSVENVCDASRELAHTH